MSAAEPDVVNAVAPVRILDLGGWTDTWFAEHGAVCNVAVLPGVEVQVEVWPRYERDDQVVVHAENHGDRYALPLDGEGPGRHPLLEEAVREVGVPGELGVEITLWSAVPPGCGTGTSASAAVALIGALDALTPGVTPPHEVAAIAHRVEVERLARESGVQDQIAAACGGVSYIEVSPYPEATVTSVDVAPAVWSELERRLVLVYLGRSHDSSAVHGEVIDRLRLEGGEAAPLIGLRQAAAAARDALAVGDFEALVRAVAENTGSQEALHPGLISADARALIDLAREYGFFAGKVNGAGGEGGSVTLLAGPGATATRRFIEVVNRREAGWEVIPIRLSRLGLQVWRHVAGGGTSAVR